MAAARAHYSIDSSSLIHAANRAYPPRRFPKLWAEIEALVDAGRIVMSVEVYHELEKKDDELFAWCKARKETLCREIDDAVQGHVVRLMRTYPRLVDTSKGKSGGDPFVLAQALATDPRLTVVTEEKGGTKEKPNIPVVCASEGLRCISVLALIEEEDWSF